MRTLFLDIPGTHCGACRVAVVGALERLEGVLTAEVDLSRSLASVTYDEGRLAVAAIEDVLAQAGYPPRNHVMPKPHTSGEHRD